jgi:hypothetical protein
MIASVAAHPSSPAPARQRVGPINTIGHIAWGWQGPAKGGPAGTYLATRLLLHAGYSISRGAWASPSPPDDPVTRRVE